MRHLRYHHKLQGIFKCEFFLLLKRIVIANARRIHNEQTSWILAFRSSGQLVSDCGHIIFRVDEHFSIELEPTVPELIPKQFQSVLTRPKSVRHLFPRVETPIWAPHGSEQSLASVAWRRRAAIY